MSRIRGGKYRGRRLGGKNKMDKNQKCSICGVTQEQFGMDESEEFLDNNSGKDTPDMRCHDCLNPSLNERMNDVMNDILKA